MGTEEKFNIRGKLISLLESFSKEEFKRFGDFVNSPYFNNERVLVELYKILKQNYPGFSAKGFVKETVFESLFPGKKYNDSIFRNTISKMLRLAEQFLTMNHLASDKFHIKLFLLEELKLKRQESLFVKHRKEAESSLESEYFKNEDYFLKKYLLEILNDEFMKITKNYMVFTGKGEVSSFEFLSNSFLINILKANASIINSNKNLFGDEIKLILFDEIENFLLKNPVLLSSNLYLRYYYYSIKIFQTNDDKYFFELRDIINNETDSLGIADRKNILTILTNYSYYRINNGELKFVDEQFKLYKLNIEKKLYKGDRDFLSHIFFMNVVTTGLDAGELEWVKDFIKLYHEELKNEHKKNMFNFSSALLHLRKKEFDNAIEYASKVISDDLSYKHQLKSFYLKIYFEMNEDQPFYSHIDSYRHFVKNDKLLGEDSREYIMNYISFSKKLFDLKNFPGKNEFEIKNIKKEITQHKALINKLWLMKKVNEL